MITNLAAIILINKKRKILFQLRDDKPTISYPNHWTLLGGHIEKGEKPAEAVKREVLEEIEYKIENPLFMGVFTDSYKNKIYVYKSQIDKKINELVLHEGQKINYFSFNEIPSLKMPDSLRSFLINNKEFF